MKRYNKDAMNELKSLLLDAVDNKTWSSMDEGDAVQEGDLNQAIEETIILIDKALRADGQS